MSGPHSLERTPWWLWGRILSLDAPAVACAWQALFARSLGQRVQPHQGWLLGLSVWLAYVADRWIEGWRLRGESVRSFRHRFAIRRRWELFGLWVLVLLASLSLAFWRLSALEWLGSLLLLGLVTAYLLSHQWMHRHKAGRPPKELCVAGIITSGAALYPMLGYGFIPALKAMSGPLLLFGLLAFANCLIIAEREKELDREHGSESLALRVPWVHRVAPLQPWLLALAGGLGSLVAAPLRAPAYQAAACAALLLALLARLSPRLHPSLPGVLADLAMFGPVLLVLLFA